MPYSQRIVRALAALGLIAAPAPAVAQTGFPAKPIRLLVGFVPGGFTDLAGRAVAQGLTESFGTQVIVENRPGANGAIAAELTARAAPDGHTFYMASPGHTTNPILQSKIQYDPVKDFTPLSQFANIPNVLVIHPSVPSKTLKELLALARARPVYLTQASSGIGSPGHLSGELLQMMTGVKFVHVPYKGSGAALTDLLGGHVDLSFPSTAAALPHVAAGKLRVLGITSPGRSQAYPDVPTLAEAGVPGFAVVGWYGLIGPARMPKDTVATLSNELMRITRQRDMRARILKAGAEPAGSSSEEFAAFIAADHAKWQKVIRAAKIKTQ
jgi:tripartite-type tricarboxylate transporter receptor subunit TctC